MFSLVPPGFQTIDLQGGWVVKFEEVGGYALLNRFCECVGCFCDRSVGAQERDEVGKPLRSGALRLCKTNE